MTWFYKGGKCGCFVLINKWHFWAQSTIRAIRLCNPDPTSWSINTLTNLHQHRLVWCKLHRTSAYQCRSNVKLWIWIFNWCKWSNIEQIILTSGPTDPRPNSRPLFRLFYYSLVQYFHLHLRIKERKRKL